jgi:hypothetical protein
MTCAIDGFAQAAAQNAAGEAVYKQRCATRWPGPGGGQRHDLHQLRILRFGGLPGNVLIALAP